MKTKLMTLGLVVTALFAATAFADDASTQGNNQMGQTQTTSPAPSTMQSTAPQAQSGATGTTSPSDATGDASAAPSTPTQSSN